jgi:beta-galactosidase
MKQFKLILLFISIITFLISCNESKTDEYIREIPLLTDWYFSTGENPDSSWDRIDIPHIPKIEPLVVNDQWQGTMWYKRNLFVKDKKKKYFLKFNGIMHEAKLWVNDQLVSMHLGGYLPMVVDITNYLNFKDKNEIKLQVNNEDNPQIPPGKALNVLDFNYYGGIYRNASLIQTSRIYITDAILENKPASGGILVHFNEVNNKKASGTVKVHVRNELKDITNLECSVKLTAPDGGSSLFNSKINSLKKGKDADYNIEISALEPFLWSVRNPHLYKLEVTLHDNNSKYDQQSLNIGIRHIELKNDGFYLNKEKLFIRGTNRHQEYPYIGYAISENANWRDAVKIKQAGFDFVRLSHYPHDEAFLDACDKLGILVMDAIPGWQFYGDSTFIQNSYQDIRDMIRRDRNHPCVVFWEVSLNESGMTEEYMFQANKLLKEELPFDDTYSAGWIDHPSYDLFIPARQHSRPPEYWNNYKVDQRPVFIAEYGDWEYYAQNAGFNQTDFQNLKEEERTSRQLRGDGEKRLLQQALNYQEATNSNRKGPNTIGHANWLMFDYNRGYADDIESSGISDIFRIPKFSFYFYQSQRSPGDTLALSNGTGPMVKIASYWTAESDSSIRIFSNCETVHIFLNDSLVQKIQPDKGPLSDYLAYPPFYLNLSNYKPGILKAVGYIQGKAVAEDIVISPGEASQLTLKIDKSTIELSKTAADVIFVYAQVSDNNGNICPSNSNAIFFDLKGNGVLIGKNPVNAEAGIASILLKTKPGEKYIIRAESKKLRSAETEFY